MDLAPYRLVVRGGGAGAEKLVEAPEEAVGVEVDVLEEADEDLLLREERAPVLQRPQVVRQKRGLVFAKLPELLDRDGLDGLFLYLVKVHDRLGPGALDGVAGHQDDLGVGHE